MRSTTKIILGATFALVLGFVAVYFGFDRSTARSESRANSSVASYIDSRSGAIPPVQQDAIEDELITLAEYEAAVHATLACAERAGLVAVPIPGEGLRPTRAGFEIPDADGVPDAETVGAGAAAIEECRAEHLDDIERAYTVQQTNVSADALDAAFLALADCMSSRGSIAAGTVLDFAAVNAQLVKVERSDSDIQWLRDYQECSLEVEAATGYRFQ